MRRCFHDMHLISSPSGQIVGVSLGYDFTSEHEWGIDGIRDAFGLPKRPALGLVGLDARTITKLPENFKFFNFPSAAYLFYSERFVYDREEWTERELDDILHARDDEELLTAWGEASFGIRMKNDALDSGKICIGQIYEAFKKLDGMIFRSRMSGGLANMSLVLAIRSRIPQENAEEMRVKDEVYLTRCI
jgi:hypothetical protein